MAPSLRDVVAIERAHAVIEQSRALCLDPRQACARAADLFVAARTARARVRLKAIAGGAGTAGKTCR